MHNEIAENVSNFYREVRGRAIQNSPQENGIPGGYTVENIKKTEKLLQQPCLARRNVGVQGNCYKFLCGRNGTSYKEPKWCPKGKMFDPLKGSCLPKPQAQCDWKTICPRKWYTHPSRSKKEPESYLICNGGFLKPETCPPGKVYSIQARNCTSP